MAQERDPNIVVPAGPGWIDIARGESDSADASLKVHSERFGPATIATIAAYADTNTPGEYNEVGVELTLGDTLELIKRLEGIARQAILDGYDQRTPDDTRVDDPLDEAAPFDSFEIAQCGEVTNPDDPSTTLVERVDDGMSRDFDGEYDRYFWTLYGVRDHDDHPTNGGSYALFDADSLAAVRKIAALVVGDDTTTPVYLIEDEAWTNINNGGAL